MFSRVCAAVVVTLWASVLALAQPLQVMLQLPFGPNLPPRIAEWIENETLIRVVVQNTDMRGWDGGHVIAQDYEGLILSVQLERDGRVTAQSRDGHPAQPRWSIGPGQTQTFSWREVVSLEALEYPSELAEQTIATGELPEGGYRLCLQVFGWPSGRPPLSRRVCEMIGIRLCCPTPIQLVAPPMQSTVSTPPRFEWTPCTGLVVCTV